MSYTIDLQALSGVYALPAAVVDKHLKLAGTIQLKVLLLGLKNPGNIREEEIAEFLSISVPDVRDALNYWVDLGVLTIAGTVALPDVVIKIPKPQKKVIKPEVIKPTREEVIKRGEESAKVAFLLREAQMKLGRPLKPNEASSFVWIHDEGMDVSVLLLLIEFAVAEGKATVSFIEKTAISWINTGVNTIKAAEEAINTHHAKQSAWGMVEKAMGIDHRRPSAKEKELAYKWVQEYGFGTAILRKAYDACVDATSNFSIPYITKILDVWYAAGVKKPEDIEALKENEAKPKAKQNSKMATFDLNLFNKVFDELPE